MSGMRKKIIRGILLVTAVTLVFISLPHIKQILLICNRTTFSRASEKSSKIFPITIPIRTEFAHPKAEAYSVERKLLEKYENRKQHVTSACGESEKLKATDKRLDHLLVDEKHKIVLCDIPKVGSTNWRRVFLIFAGLNESIARTAFFVKVNEKLSAKYLRSLKSFNRDDREMIVTEYFKFMFVRDPLDRLLSAYKDRFVLKHSLAYKEIGPKIISMFRRPKNQFYWKRGRTKGVTFNEFLRYILTLKNFNTFNPHWMPYHTHCSPCGVSYDFIGKHETMNEDAKYILDKIGERNITFPSSTHFDKVKTAKKYKPKGQYLSNIPVQILNKIFELYSKDYDLFQYTRTLPNL